MLNPVKIDVEPNKDENLLILMHVKLYICKTTKLTSKVVFKKVIKSTVV